MDNIYKWRVPRKVLTVKRIILGILAAITLTIGGFALATPAHAVSGNEWYSPDLGGYINEWSGGVFIKLCTICTAGDSHNYFTLESGSGGHYTLRFTGGGVHNGDCISDYNNNSGDARAALYTCTGGIPWGANFNIASCNQQQGYTFYDVHWGGYLAGYPNNGDQFYLNTNQPYCWEFQA
jgi:hypothetical protein